LDSKFIRKKDGTVSIKFGKEKEESPSIFQTLFIVEPCVPESISKPDPKKLVRHVNGDGHPVHYYKDQYDHCFWDPFCQCSYCIKSPDEVNPYDKPPPKRRKRKDAIFQKYLNRDPSVDTLGEYDKYQFVVSYAPPPPPEFIVPPSVSLTPPPSPHHLHLRKNQLSPRFISQS